MKNQGKSVILEVLEDFPAAPNSSRPAGSIGEVRFEIRIDYTSQKPFQRTFLARSIAKQNITNPELFFEK